MRVKLDEDLSPLVGQALIDHGHEFVTVHQQGWGGMPDAELSRKIAAEGIYFITADRGFGDIRVYPPGSHPGILVLRPDRESITSSRDLLASALDRHPLEDLAGCTAMAGTGGVRIRRPSASERPDA